MAGVDDEEDSVIILDEAGSPDRLTAPFLHLPLMQNYSQQNDSLNSEIRVAHTALSSAYGSLKTKLSKVEVENRELKLLLRKRSQPMAGVGVGGQNINSRTGTGHPQGDVGGRTQTPVTGNPILRKHSKRLEDRIESQHKRHGSWAHFNDSSSPSNDGQYLKFLEMRVETHEQEQTTMKDELKSLRLRYTDNELATSKLKQENLRLERENKQLVQQLNIHRNQPHRSVYDQTNEIEELRKMNICLQNQLKTSVEKHDKLLLINSQLEERLELRIGEQERMYEQQAKLTRTMAATGRPMAGYTQEQKLYDAMMELDGRLDSEDVTSLQSLIAMVKQQTSEVTDLKQIAKKQQKIISSLKYTVKTEATTVGGSLNTTLDLPVTCVDDMSPSNTLPPLPHHKIASQNSDDGEGAYGGGGEYVEPVFTLSTPARDEINPYISQNDDEMNDDMHRHGYSDTHRQLTRERDPGHVIRDEEEVNGEEVSDGGVFDGNHDDDPATIQYNDSEDFVIHHSNEDSSQTVVKDLKPSTILHFRQKKENNRNPLPLTQRQVPTHDNQPPLSPRLVPTYDHPSPASPRTVTTYDHPSPRPVPTYENHPPPSPHRKLASNSINNGYVNELPTSGQANGVDQQRAYSPRGHTYSTVNTAQMDEVFHETSPKRKRSSLSELPEGFTSSPGGRVTGPPVHRYSNSADHLTRCNHKPGYHNNMAGASRIMSSSTGQLYTQVNTSGPHHPTHHLYDNMAHVSSDPPRGHMPAQTYSNMGAAVITDEAGLIATRKTPSNRYINTSGHDPIHPGATPGTTHPPGHPGVTHDPAHPHVATGVTNRSSPVRYMDPAPPTVVPQVAPQVTIPQGVSQAPPQGSTVHHRAPSRHVYEEVVDQSSNQIVVTKHNNNSEGIGGASQGDIYAGFTVNQQQNTVGGYSTNQRQQAQQYYDHINNDNAMTKNLHPKVNDPQDGHVTSDHHVTNQTLGVSSVYLSNVVDNIEASRPYENVEPKTPARKTPSAHHQNNIDSTYLKVKLPPVENAESASNNTAEDSNNTLSDNTSDTATCPVCTQLFPVIGLEFQSVYEAHVDQCILANGQLVARAPVTKTHGSREDEFRKCPMCQEKFYIAKVDQPAFERHVQSHFDADIVSNFEVLNI